MANLRDQIRRHQAETLRRVTLVLAGAYLVDLIFTLVEWDIQTQYSFFPLFHGYPGWNGKLSLANYVYHYAQHVSFMLVLLAGQMGTGLRFFQVCFWVEVGDLIDYALLYNTAWVTVHGFDLDYNCIKIGVIFYTVWKSYSN